MWQLSMMNETGKAAEAANEQLVSYLKEHNCRITTERLLIAEAVKQCPRHFSADDVFRALAMSKQPVTRPTIYSMLRTMVDAGILTTLDINLDKQLFELRTTEHMHLVCRRCGNIKELRDNALIRLIRQRRYATFAPDAISLTLFGTCSSSKRKNENNIKKPTNHKESSSSTKKQ